MESECCQVWLLALWQLAIHPLHRASVNVRTLQVSVSTLIKKTHRQLANKKRQQRCHTLRRRTMRKHRIHSKAPGWSRSETKRSPQTARKLKQCPITIDL